MRYAQGFKSAGFNLDFITDPTRLEVAPEKAATYEIGLKSRLLNDKLRLNIAAFSTDYKDLQLAQIVGAGVIVANAANAEISGVEADFNAILGDYIDINGGIGYLDASYEDFAGCPVPGAAAPSVVSANCAGNFLNLAPKWTASIGAQLRYPIQSGLDLVARLDWNYRSDVFFEPQNDPRLRGRNRDLINARIGLVKERWEVFAWVLNAADVPFGGFKYGSMGREGVRFAIEEMTQTKVVCFNRYTQRYEGRLGAPFANTSPQTA